MPVNPQQLPYQVTSDAITGANLRAVQQVFMSMPRFVTVTFDNAYVEPLVLAVESEPVSIELVRIINLQSTDVPVLCGSMCHFTYLPAQGGALIRSIDGLTSDGIARYRFTFRITYKAQV